MLERRGAEVVHAPALAEDSRGVDRDALQCTTREVLEQPIDLFLATTGTGLRAWFAAAEGWGLLDPLLTQLGSAEILARGSKTVGALRRQGLAESWSPESEEFEDVLARLRARELAGLRIVVQEYGQPLEGAAEELRGLGAAVTTVASYRVRAVDDADPMAALVDKIADREVDAVTFTAAAAVATLMDVAVARGRGDEVADAFRTDVLAVSVGPVTAAVLEEWDAWSTYPERSRLAAMVKHLEKVLTERRRSAAEPDDLGPEG